MTIDKKAFVVALIALCLSGMALYRSAPPSSAPSLGVATGAGGLLIENYIPAILYNNGYYSAKDIATTGNLNAAIGTFSSSLSSGTSSPQYTSAGDVVTDGSGTTTLSVQSSSSTKGACLQLDNSDGASRRVYINSSTLVVEAGVCK